MKSMTGYGRGAVTGETFAVTVEIKTVNNRYLDVHLRLSQELSALEVVVKRRIAARLSRGRADVSVSLDRVGEVAYEVNRPLLTGYINALRSVQQEFNLAGELDVSLLARVPGALQPARDGIDEQAIAGVERAIDAGLDDLERMREIEGATLAEEMRGRVANIEAEVPKIEAAAAGLVEV